MSIKIRNPKSEARNEFHFGFRASCFVLPAKRAFTLIESMVAVSILAIAVAGPLVAANRAYVSAQIARDRLTATYLAQEGIEYIRAFRDNAYLASYQAGGSSVSDTAWNNFLYGISSPDPSSLNDCIYSNSTFLNASTTPGSVVCTLDPTLPIGVGDTYALQPCTYNPIAFPLPSCTPLYLANNNIYTQQSTGAVETPFTRRIQIHKVSSTNENVITTVSWTFHGQNYSVQERVRLYPWQ